MKALKVEFVPPRQVPAWCWYAVSALLLAIAGHQGTQAWQLWKQARAAEAKVVQLRAKLEQVQQAQREALQRQQAEPPYAKDAAEIAKVAGFPIERVFASIESAQVQGVKLVSLDVSPAEGSAKAELEFSDHDALVQYVNAINAGEEKPRWVLLRAQLGGGGAANNASIASQW